MKYFGGKQRISKPLSSFLNSELKPNQAFYDVFCGSCNVVSKINHDRPRFANDVHKELIAMWRYVQGGGVLPESISQEEYYDIKSNAPDWLKGFVGFGCSFSGKWWGGYARGSEGRNYCMNAKNSTLKKMATLKDVTFSNLPYDSLYVHHHNSMLYCDIPYKGTTGYSGVEPFNHEAFYKWAKWMYSRGHYVIVSEYKHNVPDGWTVVWEYESKKDIRDKNGIQQPTVEILMIPN